MSVLNRRYILLTSACRNRNDWPNQFEFVASSNTVGTPDFLSLNAPIVQFDLLNYFVDTDALTAPFQWQQTGTISSATSTTADILVGIDARGNAGAPDPVENQYTNLFFLYNNGVTNYDLQIQSFTVVGGSTYQITLATPIAVNNGDAFTIHTTPLQLNQTYIPTPVLPFILENEFTGRFLGEIDQRLSGTVTAFDAASQIVTSTTDYTLAVGPIYPHLFAITQTDQYITYQLSAVSAPAFTVSVLEAENPQYNSASFFVNQYLVNYTTGVTAKIIAATDGGAQWDLELPSDTDMSLFSVNDWVGILFYTSNNQYPFDYQVPMLETKSQDRSQVRIYDLELVSLMLPNILLTGDPGGYFVNYPFVSVYLENLSSQQRTDDIIFANTPNLKRANFVCPIMDISTPAYSSFTRIDGSGMICPFNIKANDTLKFTLRTPYGQVVHSEQTDPVMPYAVNPQIQMYALFAVTARPPVQPCLV